MKNKNKLILGVLAGIGVSITLLPQKTLAQYDLNPTGEARPSDTFKTQDSTDFYGGSNGGIGVMEMIHRAQMGNIRDVNEFSSEQRQNIQSAADKFRQMQLERIRKYNQNQATPNNQAQPSNTTPTQPIQK